MKRKSSILTLCLCGLLLFSGCAKTDSPVSSEGTVEQKKEGKILQTAFQYAPSSLDVHKKYQGWQTSIYGVSETLFKVNDDFSLEPWLAENGQSDDGLVWTITLKDNLRFSNGEPVKSQMVVRNLERVATENPRFSQLSDFTYEVKDDKVFIITSQKPYPTMLNLLSSCETGIMDLDKTTNFDTEIITTGPFMISKFEPEGTVEVVKNPQYWNGEVVLDGAVFYKISEADALLLAMQNGEIDCYMNVNGPAKEVFEKDKDKYTLVDVSSPRLQMYILNQKNLSQNLRKAINHTIDAEKMMSYFGGTMVATKGPFNDSVAYGQITKPAVNEEEAIAFLKEEGYTQNGEGYFEKDGHKATVNIAYYPGRSLDVMATLMQEQLKKVGIEAVLKSFEGPGDYLTTGDFDIALLSMTADVYGDPEFFITSTLQKGSYYNVGGFDDENCEKLINQLSSEMDPEKRTSLAKEIIQIAIDDDAYGYLTLVNKITVLRPGVSEFAENSPFDFYGINEKTEKQ